MIPLKLVTDESEPVRLRGHTLLCLQGFQGKGYSPEFVDNLARIHQELADNHERWVEVVDTPDAVCGACPHKAPAGCSLNGETSEEGIQSQDRRVLTLLGLSKGARVKWGEILDRIRTSVSGADLPNICGQCRWLPLGCCRDGLDRLRSAQPSTITPRQTGRER
jgi:hypothetical protein